MQQNKKNSHNLIKFVYFNPCSVTTGFDQLPTSKPDKKYIKKICSIYCSVKS